MSLNINLITEAEVPANDPSFLQKVFALVSKDNKKGILKEKELLIGAIREEYNSLSWRADRVGIQESCSIRNVMRSRAIATYLIDDDGKLDGAKLNCAIESLQKYLYPLGPGRSLDAERQEWILEALKRLNNSKELQRLLKNIHAPHGNIIAAELIRSSLNLPEHHPVTDSHARRAHLAAWMTYLRQSVGSCFATAPTIIIHQEQPEQFFRDVADLLSIGQLKRTFGGKEYSAPLSPSWGAGDLKKIIMIAAKGEEGGVELWLSPGIQAAFQELALIDGSKPLKSRISQAKNLILSAVEKMSGSKGLIMTSVEEILKQVILSHLELSEQDVKDYENRSVIRVGAGGFVQSGHVQPTAHKSKSIKRYYEMKIYGESVFKSLADCALLKAWEFTVASFAETKPTFTRWNLYASLGFDNEDVGGIAECLYNYCRERFNRYNLEIQEHQDHYDQMYPLIRNLETRLATASTEKEISWLKSDYQSKIYEFRRIERLRDEAHSNAKWWGNVGSLMLNYYDMLFPQYFQEVYDADMLDIGPNPYDDSPAGFRLLYKWGRTNSSQWTRIMSAEDFIEALVNFFTITERELNNYDEFVGRDKEMSDLISEIVRRVRSREYLETAFDRMAKAHGVPRTEDPLNNLDKISKKPWVYTSGGSINSLIGCYWRREPKLTEVAKWMESPTEFLTFIIDTMKELPANILNGYAENENKSMLMYSPTHAFLLKPGYKELKEGWENKEFTYTWVRDTTILPVDHVINQIELDVSQMEFLVELLAEEIPTSYRHYFRRVCANVWGTASPKAFREDILKKIDGEKGLQYRGSPLVTSDMIDALLYNHLPLTSIEVLEKRIEGVVKDLPLMDKVSSEELHELIDQIRKSLIGNRWVSSQQIQDICAAIVLVCLDDTAFSADYHKLIVSKAREEGVVLPEPVIFADTNWVRDKFSFVVNPGTSELELWRTNRLGVAGTPMIAWTEWLDGSRRNSKWGFFTRPYEYVASDSHPFNI